MGEKINHTPDGVNILELDSPKSKRIRTLEQLLKAAEVDLKEWEVSTYTVNKWEVAGKGGDKEDPFFVVEELFQVKARLIRKKLEPSFPTIVPLTVSRTHPSYKAPKYKSNNGIRTALLLPDPHFGFVRDPVTGDFEPFHDMRALDIAVQIAYDLRPHYVIFLGDILDLAEWSDKFLTRPEFTQTTQAAVIAANWWMGRIRDAAPGATAVLLEGNHDLRMEKAIVSNLRGAYGLRPADQLDLPPALSIPRLLALHELGVEYRGTYPNGEYWLTPNLLCQHGSLSRKGGGKSAAAMVKDYDTHVVFGHTHRLERAMRSQFNGDRTWTTGAYSLGCLCRTDGIVPGVKARQDWQQGIGVAYFSEREGLDVSLQLTEITNGRALFGDRLYTGEDRTAVLREDTGYPFIMPE